MLIVMTMTAVSAVPFLTARIVVQVGAQPARIGEYGKGNCRPRTPGRQQIEAQQLVFSGHDAAVASWQPEFGDGIAQVRDRAGQLALFLTHHALKCPRDAAEKTQAQHQGHSKIVTTNQLQLAMEACPEGKLGDFARELSEGCRRRFVTRSAVGLCLIVFLTVGIRQLLPAAEVTCTETKSHIGAYFDASLDTATRKQVKQHLSDCPHCKSFYASRSANSQATRQPNV